MSDSGSTTSSKLFKSFWALASLLWIPLCFINFDPHHDGIILTTINQIKLSLGNDGPWPFNQYGSAWAIPYLMISYLVPQNLLLLSIRLLTVSFYVLASYFLYKSALLVFSRRTAQTSVFLFLFLQPFLGPWNTSLLPWPSSLVALLVNMILYLLLAIPGAERQVVRRNLVSIGFLTAIILGSRIQVGILLLLSISGIVYFLNYGKLRFLAGGLLLWLLPFSIVLQLNGWLIPSLYDSIVLGAQFLSSDHLHYPIPFLSILAGVSAFIWLQLAISNKLNRYMHALLFLTALAATMLLSKRVLGDSFNLPNYLSVTQRKVLAAIFFASLMLICKEIFKIFLNRRYIRTGDSLIRRIILCLISISSAAQAWPFFDQMHIWWSFAPIVIIAAESFSKLFPVNSRYLNYLFYVFSISLMTFLVGSQFTGPRTSLNSINQTLVFAHPLDEKNEGKIQDFVQRNIPRGSRILNLCPNAYPFFVPGYFQSSSRFFVYWSNFESAPIDYKDYSSEEIQYVIVCQTYLYQGTELAKYVSRQNAILDSLTDLEMTTSTQIGSFNLEIYAAENQ